MTALFLTAALARAPAQPPADKPVKWEYAELAYRNIPGRPAARGVDGKENEARPPSVALRWSAGADEVTLKGWDELGEKLKVALKKDSTPTYHRLQVLNALGAEGWEVVPMTA